MQIKTTKQNSEAIVWRFREIIEKASVGVGMDMGMDIVSRAGEDVSFSIGVDLSVSARECKCYYVSVIPSAMQVLARQI